MEKRRQIGVWVSGKLRDPETGLDDFGARYNSSGLGRFMTPDWAAGAEAVPYAGLDNPQSLNLYAYALNNPVTRVDFDGHFDGPGNDPTPKCPEGGNCDPEPVAPPIQETAPPAPNWQYSQKTGSLDLKVGDKTVVHAGTGYSGHGAGLNNSEMQNVPNTGPIPQGKWRIGPPKVHISAKGSRLPFSMRLAPGKHTDTFTRTGFLMHGDLVHPKSPFSASDGCVIQNKNVRADVAASGVSDLEVVP